MDINSPTLPPTDTFIATREEDLALPLHRALAEAAEAGRPVFTLAIEPGTYRNLAISLDTSVYHRAPMTIRIRSRGPRPAVLHDCPLVVESDTIYLEDLILSGYARSSPALQLLATTAIHAERVVFLGNRSGDPLPHHGGMWSEGRIVSMQGIWPGGKPPERAISASFAHCWFLGNLTCGQDGTGGHDVLIDSTRIGKITLAHCLLADNEVTTAIDPKGPVQLTLERCLVHERRLRFGWLDLYPNSQVAFRRGLLALGNRVIRLHVGPDTPPETVHPLIIKNSMVAWGTPPPPRLISLENTRQVAMPVLPLNLAQQALESGRPDTVELMATVLAMPQTNQAEET